MKYKSFSLIEIIVVLGIITAFALIILPGYKEGENALYLQRAAHSLAQDLREAQNIALAGEEFYGQFPLGGYGLYLTEGKDSYILFADCDGDGEYDGDDLVCPDCSEGGTVSGCVGGVIDCGRITDSGVCTDCGCESNFDPPPACLVSCCPMPTCESPALNLDEYTCESCPAGTSGNCQWVGDEGTCTENAISEKIKEISLDSDILISSLNPSSPLNITFFPPEPIICINPLADSAAVELSLDGKNRNIFINTAGLIDID